MAVAAVAAVVVTIIVAPRAYNLAVAAVSSGKHDNGDKNGSVSILWVGDTTPGSYVGLPPGDGDSLYARVKGRIQSAGIATGNLEGTLSTGGSSKCGPGGASGNCFAFQAPPRMARGLRRAGFDLMNMANNHAMDFGGGAYQSTVRALSSQKIAWTGAPGRITMLRRNDTKVAFIGFSAYSWSNQVTDLGAAQRLVQRATRTADVVVVLMHAGAEGEDQVHVPHGLEMAFGENRGNTRAFAHAVIDAGADLVLGSGPHVVRGVERYHNRLVAYSLGNFAAKGAFHRGPVSSLSGMLQVQVDAHGRVLWGRWKSLRLQGEGTPTPDRSRASLTLIRRLSKADFGAGAWRISSSGLLAEATDD